MFSSLTIKTKILCAFIMIAAVCAISGGVGVWQTSEARRSIDESVAIQRYAESLMSLKARITEQRLHLKSFILTGDRADLAKVREDAALVADLAAKVRQEARSAEDKAELEAAIQAWSNWNEQHLSLIFEEMKSPETIDLARLEEASGPNIRHIGEFVERIDGIEKRMFQQLAEAAKVETLEIAEARIVVLVGALVVLAFTVGLGFVTYRLMSRIARTMNAMEAGRVDAMTADAHRRDEIGAMARAANAFREKLADIEHAEAEREAAQRVAAEEREAMLDRLGQQFGAVVEAGVAGDFSKRVDARFDDEALNALARGINDLLASVDRGVSATSAVAGRLAEGDLTASVEGEFQGAFAELKASLNATMSRLNGLVGDIAEGADATQTGSEEINRYADDLARRAESQASSLEETAATMEEMTATIRANADNAKRAQEMTTDAAGRARRGGEVVTETMGAMDRIEQSSSKIADIISVIEGIAFQTNLLALNAAVEAARAGDAGKGFAVVASEVRDLAQRSAEAAKDIKDLIGESSTNVASGAELVRRAGEALGSIVEAVDTVAKVVEDIALANREQSSGVEEISNAVSHMDQLTQQNAALATQSAGAARTLTETAEGLAGKVRFFKTRRAGSAPAATPEPVAPASKPAAAASKPAAAASKPAAAVSKSAAPASRPAPAPVAAAAGQDWSAAQGAGDWNEF